MIAVFLADGFELVEAMTPLDMLRRGGNEIITVSITDSLYVKSSNGVTVKADKLIAELGAEGTPCIRVYNKCDAYLGVLPRENDSVCISAVTGRGFDELRRKICEMLHLTSRRVDFEIPYAKSALLDLLHREAKVEKCEYEAEFISVTAFVDDKTYGYITNELSR